jgi:predicted dehydrogenase
MGMRLRSTDRSEADDGHCELFNLHDPNSMKSSMHTMNMRPPPHRVVLIGAGTMGRNHARTLGALPGFECVGVIDADIERAAILATNLGVTAVSSLASFDKRFDAAIVATPTSSHEEMVLACLDRGAHVLVEKPIAIELSSAARMIEAAENADRLLMVGHVERFNGAIQAVRQYINDPIHFSCQRVGPFDPRIFDGIILDLMIHDLDLVSHLSCFPGTASGAVAVALHGRKEDHATASVLFGERISGSFTASRVGQTKVRTMEITQPQNSISIDLIRQDITIYTVESLDFDGPGNSLRQRGMVEIPFVERSGQPLKVELEHFRSCMLGEAECLSTGEDGLRALELVRQVELSAAKVVR